MNLVDLLSRNTFHITGVINEESLKALSNGLQGLAGGRAEDGGGSARLTIAITSPGGSTAYMAAMRAIIRHTAAAFDTHMVVIGSCYSAAVSLLMAVPRARRYATAGSRFMIHPGSVPVEGQLVLDSKRVKDPVQLLGPNLKEALTIEQQDNDELFRGTKLTRSRLQKMMDNVTFFSAEEALTHGFIGHILEV